MIRYEGTVVFLQYFMPIVQYQLSKILYLNMIRIKALHA